MKREIKLQNGSDVKKLASAFKVTERTVYNALGGKTENDLSNKIRNVALKLYEANYVKSMPNEGVVTTHEGRIITHYFYGKNPSGEKHQEVSLEIDTKTGEVRKYIDGRLADRHDNVTVNQLNSIIKKVCESVNLDYDQHF